MGVRGSSMRYMRGGLKVISADTLVVNLTGRVGLDLALKVVPRGSLEGKRERNSNLPLPT